MFGPTLVCSKDKFSFFGKSRTEVMAELRALGVGSQVHYQPIHLHPFYKEHFGYRSGDFPMAEAFYDQALSLPLYPKLSDGDVARVVDAVWKVMG